MQLVHHFNLLHPKLMLSALLLFSNIAIAHANSGRIRIVTDIAPIYSLVSMVVGDHADVELLVPPSQSPHTFNLKPSQIRVINEAKLIVTLSDDFTPTISRHLKAIDKNAVVLLLSESQNENEYNEHKDTENRDHELASNQDAHLHDPHTWLNPENALLWLDRIGSAAAKLDANNKDYYLSNAQLARDTLTTMHNEFKQQLAAVSSAPYIVYHDAYQHFAKAYGLQKPIAIALSDARAPGARKLRAMRAEAKKTTCVFSERLHDDIVVDTVTQGLTVKRAILDPIGSTLPIGPNHYPQLMRALVNSFVDCLA